ncbi:DNA-binding transcriptional regulator [soil metagenome]
MPPPAPASDSASRSINSLRRGLDVLALIQRASAMTYTELQVASGLPKATLVRVLKTLVESGWVLRHAASGRYSCVTLPGTAAGDHTAHDGLMGIAKPLLTRLQHKVPWPIDLAVRDGLAMLILDTDAGGALGLAPNYRQLGSRPSMLRSSLGRCYLSHCPAEEREELLQRLRRSTNETDREAARAHVVNRVIAQTRVRGYAVRDALQASPESPERYGALAVPIFAGSLLIACLSCSWLPRFSTTEAIVNEHLADMQATAKLIGKGMDS